MGCVYTDTCLTGRSSRQDISLQKKNRRSYDGSYRHFFFVCNRFAPGRMSSTCQCKRNPWHKNTGCVHQPPFNGVKPQYISSGYYNRDLVADTKFTYQYCVHSSTTRVLNLVLVVLLLRTKFSRRQRTQNAQTGFCITMATCKSVFQSADSMHARMTTQISVRATR